RVARWAGTAKAPFDRLKVVLRGHVLGVSIPRCRLLPYGKSRTSLRLRLASAIALARLDGFRYLSSLTVSTPAACSSSAYSFRTPLMRMRSAMLAQYRSRFSSYPVFAASVFRPLTVRAASSSRSDDRIPADLRTPPTSPPIPSTPP